MVAGTSDKNQNYFKIYSLNKGGLYIQPVCMNGVSLDMLAKSKLPV